MFEHSLYYLTSYHDDYTISFSSFINDIPLITAAPCRIVTYEARELKFNQDPISVWFGEDNSEDEISSDSNDKSNENLNPNSEESHEFGIPDNATNSRYVYLYFTTPDETTYSSELIIDFPTFISSIGGNLGLFLGFSCMGALFPLYEWMEVRYIKSISNENVRRVRSAHMGMTPYNNFL